MSSSSPSQDLESQSAAASGWTSVFLTRKFLVSCIGVLLLVALFWMLPTREWVITAYHYIRGLELWKGFVAFVVVYTILSAVGLPTSPLAIGAGLLFGLPLGFLASMAGVMAACILCFIIARYLARGRVLRLVRRKPKLRTVLRGLRHESWQMILLTRLNPLLPAAVASYIFGVTPIKFRNYAAASFIGNIPLCLTLSYLGSAGQLALGKHDWTFWDYVLWGGGLAATVALTVWVTRYTKKMLAKHAASRSKPGRHTPSPSYSGERAGVRGGA